MQLVVERDPVVAILALDGLHLLPQLAPRSSFDPLRLGWNPELDGPVLGAFAMEKMLRVASDIVGYEPEADTRYRTAGLAGESEDIERLEWVSRWLGLTEPEAEILFDLNRPPYTPSDITGEHLLVVLEAVRKGEPVERDIWVRNDPARDR